MPIINYVNIAEIETENERGKISTGGYTMATTQVPPWYVPVPVGTRIRNKGKLNLAIMFGEDVPPHYLDVDDMLIYYSRWALNTVEQFEQL